MRDVNFETITVTQSWCKIQPLNEFNLIRAKQQLLRRRRGVYGSFSSRRKSRKSFTLTIRWNLANPVKTSHRIIAFLSALHRPETNGKAERAVRRIQRRDVCCIVAKQGLGKNWWAYSMECYCYLRKVQDLLLADGKTPYERRFGEPFKGPIIPFGAMIEDHPISAKGQSRLQFGRSVPWNIPRILIAGRILERRHSGCRQ